MLNEVRTKAEQEATLENVVIEIGIEDNNTNAQRYLNVKESLQELEDEFKHLRESIYINALRNSRGNVTLKAVRDKIDDAEEGEELYTLDRYLVVDKEIKEVIRNNKKTFTNIEAQYRKELAEDSQAEKLADLRVLLDYFDAQELISELKKEIKELDGELDTKAFNHYEKLTREQIIDITINDKWLHHIHQEVTGETHNVSQRLTNRVQELVERYEIPLPELLNSTQEWEEKVNNHLKTMGFEL